MISERPQRQSAIAVAVVNHNTQVELQACLRSAAAERPAQTIVVDTSSTDGSAAMVRREFPNVELVEIPNRGYGAGANAALECVVTPYVLLVNSDTLLQAGSLPALADYLDRNPGVAVAGPRIVDPQGRLDLSAHSFPTPRQVFFRESGLQRLLRSFLRPPRPGPSEWLLGAALALRCSAAREVEGFDESYFMYNEEVDLCVRLRRAGWEVHYAPVATVVHIGAVSTDQRRAVMAAQGVQSSMLLYRRYLSRVKLVQLRLILGLALGARLIRDHLLLVVTRSEERRRELFERVDVWKHALAAVLGRS